MSQPDEDRESELAALLREVRALRESIDRLKPTGGQVFPPDYAVAVRVRPEYAVAVRPELPPDYAVAVKVQLPGEIVINPQVITARDVDG